MPRLATIEGCGNMACSTYEEMTAALDRVYAVEEDQPLPIGQAFAAIALQASREAEAPADRKPSLPDHG